MRGSAVSAVVLVWAIAFVPSVRAQDSQVSPEGQAFYQAVQVFFTLAGIPKDAYQINYTTDDSMRVVCNPGPDFGATLQGGKPWLYGGMRLNVCSPDGKPMVLALGVIPNALDNVGGGSNDASALAAHLAGAAAVFGDVRKAQVALCDKLFKEAAQDYQVAYKIVDQCDDMGDKCAPFFDPPEAARWNSPAGRAQASDSAILICETYANEGLRDIYKEYDQKAQDVSGSLLSQFAAAYPNQPPVKDGYALFHGWPQDSMVQFGADFGHPHWVGIRDYPVTPDLLSVALAAWKKNHTLPDK